MTTSTLDARSRTEHDQRHRAILEQVKALRTAEVTLGRLLRDMDSSAAFLLYGATNFPTYCEKVGLAAFEGRELAALGEGTTASPALGEKVLEGKITTPAAAAVGKVLRDPALQRPGDRWLEWAERESTRDLRNRVKQRLEEARAGSFVFPLTVFLSPKGAEGFLRCRELTIRKAGRPLTEGQTFEAVVDDYLDRHDEVRRAARMAAAACAPGKSGTNGHGSPKARVARHAAEAGGPRSRHIPAEERRRVLAIAGDRCWVEGCDRRGFLEYCHVGRPFRRGGGNRAIDLARLCREHHMQMDAGMWWPQARRDGTVVLIGQRGVPVGHFRRAAPPGDRTEGAGVPPTGEARPPP
jgi:hypothetical protein